MKAKRKLKKWKLAPIQLLPLLLLLSIRHHLSYGMEAVLLDTRTAISDLGWIMPIGSEWQEMTSSDSSGNQRRMLMVCKITSPNQNNWMRSQFIPVHGAKRLYVEVEFTMRSCDDVPDVATCKETFNLYYYETDRDEATSTFPPWNDEAYTKVDTIAADQRFEPGSTKTNFEVRDIGPITKKGIYLAVQDTGACMAFMHVRVYYMFCSEVVKNLASFPRTTSGMEVTSLVGARGSCVSFAIENPDIVASLYCNGEGEWTVPSGSCLCEAGYTPNLAMTECEACPVGYYKSIQSNHACKKCPDYSLSRSRGVTACQCMEDYYRSPLDNPDLPCFKPPTQPRNLYSQVNDSTVRLLWAQPLTTGERNDLSYSVYCQSCQSGFLNCMECDNYLQYKPAKSGLAARQIEVTGLNHFADYKFKVCAINGVSSVVSSIGGILNNCAEINIKISQSGVSKAGIYVGVSEVGSHHISFSWHPPIDSESTVSMFIVSLRKIHDMMSRDVIDEDVIHKRTTKLAMTVNGLTPSTLYEIKVRAVFSSELGPYSPPVRVRTAGKSPNPTNPVQSVPSSTPNGERVNIIWPILGGVLLVMGCVVLLFICKRKRKKKRMRCKDMEKNVVFVSNTSTLPNSNAYKTYVDPTAYEHQCNTAIEFNNEINKEFVRPEVLITAGEFSEVFGGKLRVVDQREKEVAIKTLKNGSGPEARQDFLNEASIMGQFDHPNVIRLEAVVTKSLPLMIITEYVENGSLDKYLQEKRNNLSLIELVGMLRDIASGMNYLSEKRYVHRDLAARNVLVSKEMICKVSDFGLSRKLEGDTEATFSPRGEKVPLRWTAPEAITFRKFTTDSDVWSYGILMWEVMSFGQIPYWDMSNQAVLDAVEAGNRLPAPAGCPHFFHSLMLDCWRKNRSQRPKFANLLWKLEEMLQEPWKLEFDNVIGLRDSNANRQFVRLSLDLSNELRSYPHHGSSSTPLAATDSGINEDTDEECAMLLHMDPKGLYPDENFKLPSLEIWLRSLGMDQYFDNFLRNGCISIEQVSQLNSRDLDRMGILSKHDQDLLLNNIQNLLKLANIRKSFDSIDKSEIDL